MPDLPDPDRYPRVFSLEEANALLPLIESVFQDLDGMRVELDGHLDRLHILDLLWGAAVRDPGNPDREEFLAERAGIRAAIRRIEAVVTSRITPLGVRFPPGGLELGLVDFPTILDGRWIFLCWRRGEPRVEAWHETDGGFRGRQPLTADVVARLAAGG